MYMNLFYRINKTSFLGIIIFVLMISCREEKPFIIYTIGDSTMASYNPDRYPLTGWGQVLQSFFNEEATVKNHASSGRSSKSFISEGRWKAVQDSLNAGDYVFIQFGHNDNKKNDTTRYAAPYKLYKQNLVRFVLETRLKGAKPILFTPIARRAFDENGLLKDSHGDYALAVILVSDSLDVPLVDMNSLTSEFISQTGIEESKKIYLWVEPNDNFPEGKEDNTHLSDLGAREYARLALEELSKHDASIAMHLITGMKFHKDEK